MGKDEGGRMKDDDEVKSQNYKVKKGKGKVRVCNISCLIYNGLGSAQIGFEVLLSSS